MSLSLSVVAALIGLVLAPVLVAISVRVFTDGDLVLGSDFTRPLRLPADIDSSQLGRWELPLTMVVMLVVFGVMVPAIDVLWVLPSYLWFAAVAMVLTLTDIDRKLIPNRVLYPGTVTGAVLLAAGSLADWNLSALGRGAMGAIVYFAFLYLVYLVARGGFGLGDVKLGFFIGLFAAYLGWPVLFLSVAGAFLIGGLVSIVLLVLRIKGRRDAIPFGPYMVGASYIAILWHEPIRAWYGV